MFVLTGKTLVSAIRPPYPYGNEFVSQFLFALRLGWFPMIVTSVALTYGPAGIQAANFLNLFGALDRLGGLFVLAVMREFAPLVCAIVMAGVAGTAMCADLGARKIREELDALMVLGVDPVKNLVVPRFLSLMLVTGLFDIYALIFGTFGGMLVTLVNGAPLGGVLLHLLHERDHDRALGLAGQDDDLRRDHRHRLLLQGHDRLGRRRGRGARGQPGGGHRLPGHRRRSTTSSPRRCWPRTPSCRWCDDPAGHRTPGLDRVVRPDGPLLRPGRRRRLQREGVPVLRRDPAAGRDPDHGLGPDHPRAGLHPRPPVRDRGRLRERQPSARPRSPARSPRCATCARSRPTPSAT